jgi:hypothetical protein
MAQKKETVFRGGHVRPFLMTLKNSTLQAIQQKTFAGTPDFLGVCNRTPVALELKTDVGVLHPLQKYFLAEWDRCGGVAIVASPTNWEEVKALLTKLDRGESR